MDFRLTMRQRRLTVNKRYHPNGEACVWAEGIQEISEPFPHLSFTVNLTLLKKKKKKKKKS